jgi:hypothetical protein
LGENITEIYKMDKNQFEFVRHVYDLDIIEIFLRLKGKVRDKRLLLKGANSEELIERWENVIKDYCGNNEIDFDASLDKGTLLVPNKHGFYIIALVMRLMAIEDFKIPMLLDYQKGLASNKAEFIGTVEFNVLGSFKNNSPFKDSNDKITEIRSWITFAKSKLKSQVVKEVRSFESLFRDKGFPKKLRTLLESESILESGTWVGLSKKRTEVNILIRILQENGYLYKLPKTLIAELFCKEFGIKLSQRSMRNEPKGGGEVEGEYRRILEELG